MYSYFMIVGNVCDCQNDLFGKTLKIEYKESTLRKSHILTVKVDDDLKIKYDSKSQTISDLAALIGKPIMVKGLCLSDGLHGKELSLMSS